MIGFWDLKLTGAPPLLSFVVRPHQHRTAVNHTLNVLSQFDAVFRDRLSSIGV